MSTAQQSLVTVTIDGISIGVFDTLEPGAASADNAKHRPGGMGDEKVYTGLPTYEQATVTRVYERERDVELVRGLRPRAGKANASVSDQPLDDDGAPWGTPVTYNGKLSSVTTTGVDSTSGEPRMVEIVITVGSIA